MVRILYIFLYIPDLIQTKPEKPKRKGPLDVVPVTAEDWACYDAPPEVVEAFSHGSMRQTGVNRTTITKPVSWVGHCWAGQGEAEMERNTGSLEQGRVTCILQVWRLGLFLLYHENR